MAATPVYIAKRYTKVYMPRIQRGDAFFAAKLLGARGILLSILAHFFEHGRWGVTYGDGRRGQRCIKPNMAKGCRPVFQGSWQKRLLLTSMILI
jgi:hypothetical protein